MGGANENHLFPLPSLIASKFVDLMILVVKGSPFFQVAHSKFST